MSADPRPPVPPSRIDYLDGVRAVAIAAVLAVHWAEPYLPLLKGGYVGVDVFFVLSGFLITGVLWGSNPVAGATAAAYADFLRRRARRLLPALVTFLVVGTALVAGVGSPVPATEAARSAAISVAQATSVVRGLVLDDVDPFTHTWSLSVEWMFYLAWPVVLLAWRSRGVSEYRVALGAVIGALACYAASLATTPEWFYYGPTSRTAQLLAGCAASLWLLRAGSEATVSPWLRRAGDWGASLALAVIVVWTVVGPHQETAAYRWFGFPLLTLSAVVLCWVSRLRRDTRAGRLLSWAPLGAIGRSSYSLYLWHVLGIQVLTRDTWGWPPLALAGTAIAGTVVATWLSYRYLEVPMSRSLALQSRHHGSDVGSV